MSSIFVAYYILLFLAVCLAYRCLVVAGQVHRENERRRHENLP